MALSPGSLLQKESHRNKDAIGMMLSKMVNFFLQIVSEKWGKIDQNVFETLKLVAPGTFLLWLK